MKQENFTNDLFSAGQATTTPFTDRKMVVTGDFARGRSYIGFQFKRMGADIEPNVTKNIHFVVIGSNPDAARMERLDKLIHDGYNIRNWMPSFRVTGMIIS